MNSYNSASSAYAQSAGEINSNLAGYRGDVDRVRGLNKTLKQQAEQTIDLNALKGIGEEAAVRAFKTYGGKALSYVDNKLLGGSVQADTEGLKNKLEGKARNLFQSAKDRVTRARSEVGGEGNEVGEEGTEMTDLGGRGEGMESITGEAENGGVDVEGNLGDEALVDEPEETAGSFEDFMAQFDTPMTDTGDIDFVRSSNQSGMRQADAESRQMNQQPEEKQDVGEETKEGEEGGESEPLEGEEGATDMGEGASEDLADGTRSALKDATGDADDALAGLGEDAGEEGAETAISGGLEAAGAGLDATGIGAVIGVPLQIAGAVLEGGALVEAAKSVWDWFDDDILGNNRKASTVTIPKLAPSLAQRGMLITPNMDTLDQQPSYGGF